MARVSARVIFVCRVVLGETLSVDWRERGTFGTNPLSRLRRQLFPFLSPIGDIFPRPGEVFRRESPWQRGQVSSSFVNGRKKPAVKLQTLRPCQSLALSGEVARRSRDGEGCLSGRTPSVAYGDSCSPFCRLPATSSPGRGKSFHSGGGLGKKGEFRPHRSTAEEVNR